MVSKLTPYIIFVERNYTPQFNALHATTITLDNYTVSKDEYQFVRRVLTDAYVICSTMSKFSKNYPRLHVNAVTERPKQAIWALNAKGKRDVHPVQCVVLFAGKVQTAFTPLGYQSAYRHLFCLEIFPFSQWHRVPYKHMLMPTEIRTPMKVMMMLFNDSETMVSALPIELISMIFDFFMESFRDPSFGVDRWYTMHHGNATVTHS